MKTYTLSVNTLTWNLTSERHDNCAPCLGLILPIRWVMPPPTFLVWSVSPGVTFAKSSHLFYLQHWFVFRWFSPCWFSSTQIYSYICVLSSTAYTYSYVFSFESFELSECDRTLISLCLLSQTLSVQIICILLKLSNVFSASLSAEDTETNIKSYLNDSSLLSISGEVGTTLWHAWRAWERGTTLSMLHACHVPLRCEPPGAPA